MDLVTACTLDCPDACSLLVSGAGPCSLRIRGNPEHPVTAGFTCAKIKRLGRRLTHPRRITTPLLRVRAGWQTIPWEEALDLCAERIRTYSGEPASILHIHGFGDKGVSSLASPYFFARIGASGIAGSLCDEAGIAACLADFGSLETNDILDLANARRIVNWGKDLSRSSIHVAGLVRQARRRGARVLTISPGGDGNRGFTDSFIRIRPGTDRFLAAAVIRLLLERNEIREVILERTRNWPQFLSIITGRSLSDLAGVCGLSQPEVEEVSSWYAEGEPVATLIGWGLQRHRYGGENVRFINALALLSGNVGRSGAGSYFNISSMRNFNRSWLAEGIAPSPARRRLLLPCIGQEILRAQEPPVRMIWVNGCNVVNQAPDSRDIVRAFAATEFKVVVDAFMTDTASVADLILPCTLMLEKEDLVGSFLHNYVNYARKAVEPPGQARSDFQILSELGRRLDPPVLLPAAEEFLQKTLDSPHLGISLDEIRRRGFVRAKRPEIVYSGLRFDHPDAKYHLPSELHDELRPPPGYPFRLLTLVRRESIHSQILPEAHEAPPRVWIAPDNPAAADLDLRREVFLVSHLGRLTVRVEIARGLHPQVVVYRRGDWLSLGGGANQLIAAEVTDMGECAAFYSQHVRLEN
jgi:anaerobic selenocysteine-containing dehydrogenase